MYSLLVVLELVNDSYYIYEMNQCFFFLLHLPQQFPHTT